MTSHARKFSSTLSFGLALMLVLSTFVVPLSSASTAVSASYSLLEDGGKNMTLRGGATIRGESLSYSVSTEPLHGTVTLSGSKATYKPNANYNGSDLFYFKTTGSSSGVSSPALVSLSISAVNDAPIANSYSGFYTDENVTVYPKLGGTDVDGDNLTCAAVSALGGTFLVDSSTCMGTFTPLTNFSGTGSLTYKVYDGKAYSSSVVVPVTVNAVNYAPVASDVVRSLNEDSTMSSNFQAVDADSDSLTYQISKQPEHGTVTLGSGAAFSYTPVADYNGVDSFKYVALDATHTSNEAKVSLTVNAVEDVPVANALSVTALAGVPLLITLPGTDVDGDALTYMVDSQPFTGTLGVLNGNQVTYTADEDSDGEVSFKYTVSDGLRSSFASVTIIIDAKPIAHEVIGEVVQGGNLVVYPMTSDPEGVVTTMTLLTAPAHGTLFAENGGWSYTPAAGFFGVDTFQYQAKAGTTLSLPGLVRINVTPPTGIAATPIVQLGMNFVNILDPQILIYLEELGAQGVRQILSGDEIWSNVQLSENEVRDPAPIAAARLDLLDAGIAITNTLFSYQFASCTQHIVDYTDPAQMMHTVTPECENYLDYAIADLAASVPVGSTIINEYGNELFHWVAYPDVNYTPEEQAAVFQFASDKVSDALTALGYRVITEAPSIMIEVSSTWDWWYDFTAALDKKPDIQNYHYYADPDLYLVFREAFDAAEMWDTGTLTNMTEFGFSDDPTYTRGSGANSNPTTKAANLAKVAVMAWGSGDSALYYHTLDNFIEPDNSIRGTGLINFDGTWTPAAYAYRLIRDELVPFTQVVDLTASDRLVMNYAFRTNGGATKWVTWGAGTATVPAGVSKMTSMVSETGDFVWQAVQPGQTFELSDIPVLLK